MDWKLQTELVLLWEQFQNDNKIEIRFTVHAQLQSFISVQNFVQGSFFIWVSQVVESFGFKNNG